MKVFDLHCDTLYKAVTMSHGFSCFDYEVQTDVVFEKYLQCFAVWIPDDLSIKQGRALFEKAKITLPKECKINNINLVDSFKEINNSTTNKLAMFTLENCKIIDNDISYIKYLAEHKNSNPYLERYKLYRRRRNGRAPDRHNGVWQKSGM